MLPVDFCATWRSFRVIMLLHWQFYRWSCPRSSTSWSCPSWLECMRWDRIRSQKYALVPICPKKSVRPYIAHTVSWMFFLWDRMSDIRSRWARWSGQNMQNYECWGSNYIVFWTNLQWIFSTSNFCLVYLVKSVVNASIRLLCEDFS